jgi:Tol biopolymer transport system component
VATVRLVGALAGVLLLVLLESGGASARQDGLVGTIVFAGGDETSSDIYSVRADGAHLRQLTRTKAWEQSPSWSPDGKSIVYVLAEGKGGALYRMSATGRNRRLFLREDASANGFIADPQWSPDGKRLSFSSQRLGDLRVWTIGLDGTLTMVTKTFGTHATWSPDGRHLAYAGLADTGRSAIFVIGADGHGRRQVTQPDASDQQPVWSPDGKWIAFESLNADWRRHQVDSLEIVRPDGTGRRRVLRGASVISPDAWSPQSDRILFRRSAGGQSTVPGQLFTVGVRGGLATPVPSTYGVRDASWHR